MESHITMEELLFWDGWNAYVPLYETLRNTLAQTYPDLRIKVSKSQISFYNRHMFAMVSPPARRKKGWPRDFILVSFGLSHPVQSPRIAVCTEAYQNRWTHHVLVEREEELDEELFAWIDEAYQFSENKGRNL